MLDEIRNLEAQLKAAHRENVEQGMRLIAESTRADCLASERNVALAEKGRLNEELAAAHRQINALTILNANQRQMIDSAKFEAKS